jgi:hypothetical protein
VAGFNKISRGVMLRAEPISLLWPPFVFLALLGLIVLSLASLRSAPSSRPPRPAESTAVRRRAAVGRRDGWPAGPEDGCRRGDERRPRRLSQAVPGR